MNIPDIIPKITDMKNLQDLSKVLAIPMLMVAYILQDGPQIGWEGKVWFDLGSDLPQAVQLARLVIIFVVKGVWVSFIAFIGYSFVAVVHVESDFFRNIGLLAIVANLLFGFAILGLFGTSKVPPLSAINPFWWYALIVWGFFFLTMNAELSGEGN